MLTFGACLVLLICRAWSRLVQADFWAEDGWVFLGQGLSEGVASLLVTMDGSYQTIQRLAMLTVIHTTPLSWWPTVVCAICLCIVAAVASKVTSDDYAWLVPSTGARVVTACAFCLLPGLTEMLGSLCNINWILFSWLALVGLKDPARVFTRWELCASALVSLSIGTTVLLLPLFVWRAMRSIMDGRPWHRQWSDLLVVATLLTLGAALLLLLPSAAGAWPGYFEAGERYWDQLARLTLIAPWAGADLTTWLFRDSPRVALVVGALILTALVVRSWTERRRLQTQALWLLVGGISGWTVLVMLARSASSAFLLETRFVGLFEVRYAFPMSFAGLLLWMTVLRPATLISVSRPSIASVFLVLTIVHGVQRFRVPPYGTERLWAQFSPALLRADAVRCRTYVTVPTYPDPKVWVVTYEANRGAPRCRVSRR